MMGIQPSEAESLTWWKYQAMLWNWNDRHTPEEEREVEAPDTEYVARQMEMLERRGISRSLH